MVAPWIIPGMNVDIIIGIDYLKDIIDVRRSVVYDIVENHIILSQTRPPLKKDFIGKNLTLTFLSGEPVNPARYGFSCTLLELTSGYRLSSSEEVAAFKVKKISAVEQHNLRMSFRVIPRGDNDIMLFLEGHKTRVIDISCGGAKVAQPLQKNSNKTGTRVNGKFVIEKQEFEFQARVLRSRQKPSQKPNEAPLEFLSLQFLNLHNHTKYNLERRIRQIERERLFKEVNP